MPDLCISRACHGRPFGDSRSGLSHNSVTTGSTYQIAAVNSSTSAAGIGTATSGRGGIGTAAAGRNGIGASAAGGDGIDTVTAASASAGDYSPFIGEGHSVAGVEAVLEAFLVAVAVGSAGLPFTAAPTAAPAPGIAAAPTPGIAAAHAAGIAAASTAGIIAASTPGIAAASAAGIAAVAASAVVAGTVAGTSAVSASAGISVAVTIGRTPIIQITITITHMMKLLFLSGCTISYVDTETSVTQGISKTYFS